MLGLGEGVRPDEKAQMIAERDFTSSISLVVDNGVCLPVVDIPLAPFLAILIKAQHSQSY